MAGELPVRKHVRLRAYDYSQPGMYFVTICTHERVCLFGEVVDDEVRLSPFGEIARTAWLDLPNHHAGVRPDALVIMPNHVHGILDFTVGARPASTAGRAARKPVGALGDIVGAFKSSVARQINALRGTPAAPIWQRGFHDRVIRTDEELYNVRKYIAENPLAWHLDRENPNTWR